MKFQQLTQFDSGEMHRVHQPASNQSDRRDVFLAELRRLAINILKKFGCVGGVSKFTLLIFKQNISKLEEKKKKAESSLSNGGGFN